MVQPGIKIPEIKQSYLICSMPRSGSSLLAQTLKAIGFIGRPSDYFAKSVRSHWRNKWGIGEEYQDYIETVLHHATTPNQIFGAKIMYPPFREMLVKLRRIVGDEGLSELELLALFFPNLYFLHITRREKLRQAISLTRSVQKEVWSTLQAKKKGISLTEGLEYNYDQIRFYAESIASKEAKWQAFFQRNNIEPYHIVYEDFVANYDETIIGILQYLGVAIPVDFKVPAPLLKKQADEITEVWMERFLADDKKRVTDPSVSD